MKVYAYYISYADLHDGEYESMVYPEDPNRNEKGKVDIYAITRKKKYVKWFEKDRDMKKFERRTLRFDDEDELLDFINNHRGLCLEEHTVFALNDNPYEPGKSAVRDVPMLLTYEEHLSLEEAMESIWSSKLVKSMLINPCIFTRKLQDTLRLLGYMEMYRIAFIDSVYKTDVYNSEITAGSMDIPDYGYHKAEELADEYGQPDVWVDELHIFLMIYGHLFKA